jgi:hypothetical protein
LVVEAGEAVEAVEAGVPEPERLLLVSDRD